MDAVFFTTAEPLPLYVQDQVPQSPFDALLTRIAGPISTTHPRCDARTILESFVEGQKPPAYNGPEKSPSREPIDHYPLVEPGSIADNLTRVKRQIVKEFFDAIWREDAESIALLIQYNLVTANTTSEIGLTPLLDAISTKNIAIVKEILEFGADCNKFGVAFRSPAPRTPLMLAASIGSLSIVKLLLEPPYSADDALVAPDGEIALRLAAENGHHAIVDYLPSRRAGGYLRFKTHNAHSIAQIKNALRHIATFIKIFVWYLPKFFVWDTPKYLAVPVLKGCKWCWANRKKFGLWCKHQLTEMPKRLVEFGKAVWKTAKKVPGAVWKAAKKTPAVIREVIKWTWEGISSLARAIGDIFLRIVSFLHTVLEAIVTFLRTLTLRDVWNAFCDFLRAVFVTVPETLWSWIQSFGKVSYKIMKTLLGWFGEMLWWTVWVLKEMVIFVPTQLGIILLRVGSTFTKAFSEIRVWISPKA